MSRVRYSAPFGVLCALLLASQTFGQETLQLSKEEISRFLLTAKIVDQRQTSKGTTVPFRLTLKDERLMHDAHFQPIDERKMFMQFDRGGSEINFVDSYHYNIAAYELAELLGVGDMVPVTVERTWNGKRGSIAWWVDTKMDEEDRLKQNLHPPDIKVWNQQMHKVRVFGQLVCDTDRNLGNNLITEDWKVWMVDFTRAFRLTREIRSPRDLVQCSRDLFERMQTLTLDEVTQRVKKHLSKSEIAALMARRDKIIAHFQKLIAEKGLDNVLY